MAARAPLSRRARAALTLLHAAVLGTLLGLLNAPYWVAVAVCTVFVLAAVPYVMSGASREERQDD
jgi:membrane protein YdbS with pleckstrin-like domain